MEQFRIALAQSEPHLFDKENNLAKAEAAIRQAAAQGAELALFPELYLTGYSLGEQALALAEPCDGPSVRRVADLARRYRVAVVMGYPELSPDRHKAFDAAFVVDQRGDILGSYRKMHLFQAEADSFVPGDSFCVFDFGLGPVGVLICYDLEFPEAARDLALRGARWIATSTGNMVPNQHLQELYVQARAAENRLWVAVANRIGREGAITFFGGSGVADPFGKLAAQAGEEETLLTADIDLSQADIARLNADYLADRRPQDYTQWADK